MVPKPAATTAAAGTDLPAISLAALAPGGTATVVAVVGDDALAQRLAAAGFWPGVAVEWLGAAPFGGPLWFRLHGYRLALRRVEAARVHVVELTT